MRNRAAHRALRIPAWLQVAALVASALLAGWPVLGLGLLGDDVFPILRSCAAPGGPWAALFEPLLPGVGFYRPVTTASLCLDHALWDLAPRGYHATSLLWLATCALALFCLASRLLERRWAAWATAALFALHPVQQEILPFPARRGDLICGASMLLALSLQLSTYRVRRRRARALALFALSLLCVAAKETGALLPLFAFALARLAARGPGRGARWVHAAREAAPAALGVAVWLAARIPVVADLGSGCPRAGPEHLDGALRLARWLALPAGGAGAPLLAACALAVALTALLARRLAAAGADAPFRPRTAGVALFAALWLLSTLLLHAFSGKLVTRYLFFPVVGWALLLGALLAWLGSTVARPEPRPLRAAAAASAALLLAVAALPLRSTLPFDAAARARLASRSARVTAQLEDLRAALAATPRGRVSRRSAPHWAIPLRQLQIDAWLALAYPGERVRALLTAAPDAEVSAAPDERVVVVRLLFPPP